MYCAVVSFEISPSEKFAVVSLERDKCLELPKEGLQIADNFFATSFLPFDLDATWEADLGTITCNKIRKSHLFFLVKKPSESPQILDGENEELAQEVLQIRWGLLLLGMPRSYTHHLMIGAFAEDGKRMRSHSELNMLHWISKARELAITTDVLREAYRLGEARKNLYKNSQFTRIKRGLHALFRSFEEGSRFHDLVRAIEAIILPRIGKTKSDFVHRCEQLLVASEDAKVALKEIYDIRSTVEHMHHHFEGVKHLPEEEREEAAFGRLRQLDGLTRYAYIQLVQNMNGLLSHFESDESIAEYWANNSSMPTWPKLDLESIE
jgi:hypothetical protein